MRHLRCNICFGTVMGRATVRSGLAITRLNEDSVQRLQSRQYSFAIAQPPLAQPPDTTGTRRHWCPG